MDNMIPIMQALEEREHLMKKIRKRIELARLADLLGCYEEKIWNKRGDQKRFEQTATDIFQQIRELTERYKEVNEAIEVSDETAIALASCEGCTKAYAKDFRNWPGDSSISGEHFEWYMRGKMRRGYYSRVLELERRST